MGREKVEAGSAETAPPDFRIHAHLSTWNAARFGFDDYRTARRARTELLHGTAAGKDLNLVDLVRGNSPQVMRVVHGDTIHDNLNSHHLTRSGRRAFGVRGPRWYRYCAARLIGGMLEIQARAASHDHVPCRPSA